MRRSSLAVVLLLCTLVFAFPSETNAAAPESAFSAQVDVPDVVPASTVEAVEIVVVRSSSDVSRTIGFTAEVPEAPPSGVLCSCAHAFDNALTNVNARHRPSGHRLYSSHPFGHRTPARNAPSLAGGRGFL